MSDNKLFPSSSLSADSSNFRYQKALKQITKLISLNTHLREQLNKHKQTIVPLNQKINQQQKQINELNQIKLKIETQMNQIITTKQKLQFQNQQLNIKITKLSHIQIQEKQQEIKNKNLKGLHCDGYKNVEYFKIFSQLEKALEQKDNEISQLKTKIKETSKIQTDINKKQNIYTQNFKTELNNYETYKKLEFANQYIQKLNNECASLRRNVLNLQNRNSLLIAKSVQTLPKYRKNTPRQGINDNIQFPDSGQIWKKFNKIQKQNKKLLKKNDQYYHQIQTLKNEKTKMQNQIDKSRLQILKFQELTLKQQQIISKLHADFDLEVKKMTDQFKFKLQQQRSCFSSRQLQQNLKTMQNIQIENKQLRKKFNLCSIEFTKCVKTLQVYKKKLNECETDYQQLLAQKQELLLRMKNLYHNTNEGDKKQKSSRSRKSSAINLLDQDMRDSMRDTCHFNYD